MECWTPPFSCAFFLFLISFFLSFEFFCFGLCFEKAPCVEIDTRLGNMTSVPSSAAEYLIPASAQRAVRRPAGGKQRQEECDVRTREHVGQETPNATFGSVLFGKASLIAGTGAAIALFRGPLFCGFRPHGTIVCFPRRFGCP